MTAEARADLVSKLNGCISNHWGLFKFKLDVTCADDVLISSYDALEMLEKARPMKCMAKVIPLLEDIIRFFEFEELISSKRSEVSTQVNYGLGNYYGEKDISYFNNLYKNIEDIAYTKQLIAEIDQQLVNCYGDGNDDDFQIHFGNAISLMEEVMELESECNAYFGLATVRPAKG
jgi:hypothetical protein